MDPSPSQENRKVIDATIDSGIRIIGRDTLYSGASAIDMLRRRAALLAAAGDSGLAMQLEMPIWRRAAEGSVTARSGARSLILDQNEQAATEAAALANIPTDAWQARILGSMTRASASGSSGTVSTAVAYFGSHASSEITYSLKKGDSTVLTPRTASDSEIGSHAWRCVESVTALARCDWMGNFTTALPVNFQGRTCGATLTASALHKAWFGLGISISYGGIGVTIAHLGFRDQRADADHSANNGECAPPVASFSMSAGGQSATSGGHLTAYVLDPNGIQVKARSTSSAGGGTITAYSWKLDGNVIGTGDAFETGFSVGTHDLSLTVTNSQGITSVASGTVTVVDGSPPDTTSPPSSGGGEPEYRGEYEDGDDEDPSGGFKCMLYWHEYASFDGGQTWESQGRTCINWSWAEMRAEGGRATTLSRPFAPSVSTRAVSRSAPTALVVVSQKTPVDGKIAVTRRSQGKSGPIVIWVRASHLSAEALAAAFSSVPVLLNREERGAMKSAEYRVDDDVTLAKLPATYRSWVDDIMVRLTTGDPDLAARYGGSRAIRVVLDRRP